MTDQLTVQRHVAPNPLLPLPAILRGHAPQVAAKLAADMLTLAEAIEEVGEVTWGRLLAWENPRIPGPERGGGNGGANNHDRARELLEERQAGRYAEKARTASARIVAGRDLDPSVYVLRMIVAGANPPPRRQLGSREVLAAQAAADGWCRSCIRVGVFEPIGRRPTGEPYWRDLCRWCGGNKGAQDQPHIDMVKVHHRIHFRKAG